MKCPTCDVNLLMADKNGIEIDYCPNCRGIWLDRGELDKIIERSADHYSQKDNSNRGQNQYGNGDRDSAYPRRNTPYKKKSFLSEIFDF